MLKTLILFDLCLKRLNINLVRCLATNALLRQPNNKLNYCQTIGINNNSNTFLIQQTRFKKTIDKSKQNAQKDENENDEDEDDYVDEEEDDDHDIKSIDTSTFPPGFKIVKKHVSSLRFDTVLAAGLNVSRNKVDDLFYSSKLRLNGNKLLKKSSHVSDKDRLDLIGDVDEKSGKRTLKRVILYKTYETKSKTKNKPKCILISWKSGLFEEDAYKSFHL